MYGSDNGRGRLGNYTDVGMKVSGQASSYLSVSVSIDNALNERYQTILGYPMPGRTLNAGLQMSF
jgi:outer membrane cobalamin receptor